MRWIRKLWNRFRVISFYERDKHYRILDSDIYLLLVIINKGPYMDLCIDYTIQVTDEDHQRIQVIPRFTINDAGKPASVDIPMTDDMYRVAYQIFTQEYRTALNNYNNVKQEVLNDEDDGTDYFEESNEDRTVSPQGDSLSKRRVFSTQKRKTRVPGDASIHSKVQPPADHGSDTDIFGGEG